jgi:Nickel responsive protein SCO4226-like
MWAPRQHAAAPANEPPTNPNPKEGDMPRYVIERTFPEGLGVRTNSQGEATSRAIIECNSDGGVTWLHSYVSVDDRKTFCVYDAPSPEAIRKAAARNKLPVDRITRVRVLDPYFAG